MKKIFRILGNAVKWYFTKLEETYTMCPSCMIPASAIVYSEKIKSYNVKKAA